jgi:cysteine-rich repeat protein
MCLAASSTCVTADQLRSCASLADGQDCVAGSLAGICQNGACTITSCGNDILELGELCDDGNRISGDGCSGICTLEVCGDGLVDIAAGEGCDCGTAEHVSPSCTMPNSDDPAAECTTACKPRFCGDDIVGTIEQCDGSVPSNVSCTDFGYYGGDLSCSSLCQLDPHTCSGRCGDAVIDPTHGEYCDGATPSGASCLDFSGDYGRLACTSACAADNRGCGKFAATVIHDRGTVTKMFGWTNELGVVYPSGEAWAHTGTTWVQAPGTGYRAITGDTTGMWAIANATVARWTAAGGWSMQAAPWTDTVHAAWSSPTLGLFVSLDGDAALWRLQGATWTQLTGPWSVGADLGQSGTLLYAGTQGVLATYDGATVTDLGMDFAAGSQLVEADDGSVWIAFQRFSGGDYLVTHGFIGQTFDEVHGPIVDPITAIDIARTPAGILLGLRSDISGTVHTWLHLFGPESLDGAWLGYHLAGDGPTIYQTSVSTGGVFTIGGAWSGMTTGPHFGGRHVAGGTLILDAASGFQTFDDSGSLVDLPYGGSNLAITKSGTAYYAEDPVFHDGANDITTGPVASTWVAPDDTAVAVVGDHTFAYRDGANASWQFETPTIAFSELGGTAIGDLYAIGTGDGQGPRLWHRASGTWTAVTADLDSPHSLVVVASGVYVLVGASPVSLLSYDPSTQMATTAATPERFVAITAVGPNVFGGGSRLYELLGGAWWPVRSELAGALTGLIGGDNEIVAYDQGFHTFRVERFVKWSAW